MPFIKYQNINLGPKKLDRIKTANAIIAEYAAQGFDLTLRQLYYQHVARGLISNTLQEYKKLGELIGNGRLAGLVDWNAIVDRTRHLRQLPSWNSPAEIVDVCARQFRMNKWKNQPYHVEVWIEKDALVGVFEQVCNAHSLPLLSCRGYTSLSEVWQSAQRLKFYDNEDGNIILHFGDHDPSGIDMTRDIQDRLNLFGARCIVKRLALNLSQVEEFNPPPNPAKTTDSRFQRYEEEFGDESWELDALDPTRLAALLNNEIANVLDQEQWDRDEAEEQKSRDELKGISRNYTAVCEHVRKLEES